MAPGQSNSPDAAAEQRLQDLHARPQRVVVDWDGTCVPNAWPDKPRDWLPGAREALHKLISAGYLVQIHSVRLHSLDVNLDRENPSRDEDYAYIREMLDEAGLPDVEIVNDDKPPAVAYIDDRGVHFDGDWNKAIAGLLAGETPGILPTTSAARKSIPVTTGVLDYFPAAIAAVAAVSKAGNDKHNPGEPLHWARAKSTDEADAIGRHLLERGGFDPETGQRHSAQLAWRALALLQKELEDAGEAPLARGAR